MKLPPPSPAKSAVVSSSDDGRGRPITARIVARHTLKYAEGADPSIDRPAHVRAGSGLCLVDTPRGKRLLLVQDDASFLALVDPATSHVASITLPAGPGGKRLFDEGRGNKKDKLDLECVGVLPSRDGPLVVALGSGSSDQRERVVVARVDREPPSVRVVDAAPLYAALRAHPLMKGAELNLEGMALLQNGTLRLFQRGNGTGNVDATFDVSWPKLRAFLDGGGEAPPILEGKRWDLGTIDGVRLTFTDACTVGDRVVVVASAEDSPNAVDDGVVVGCALGVLGSPLAPILDEKGAPFIGKPEGVVVDPADHKRAWLVLDKDDPTVPCELLTLAVDGL